jgi:hypothetical protein
VVIFIVVRNMQIVSNGVLKFVTTDKFNEKVSIKLLTLGLHLQDCGLDPFADLLHLHTQLVILFV